jgi:hypothetical protein
MLADARDARFCRGAGRSLEGRLSFAFGLFDLNEERHANHAHGSSLAVLVLDGQCWLSSAASTFTTFVGVSA